MKVIFLMGPIASGKGTQADILAKKFGFFHFETSKFLEANFKKPELAKEKEKFDSGQWNDPSWVAGIVCKEAGKLVDEGREVIFSGSPRTVEEAILIIPCFEDKIGKENILFLNIDLSEQESVKRSLARRICKANRHPIPGFPEFQKLTACPEDGSELIRRSLDKPEIISRRYQEHLNRTVPIFDFLKNHGYSILEINGEQSIEKVSGDILNNLSFRHDQYQNAAGN
ncbi:MAG: nucleoside monophosphate kinase [bacterium]|nr:nucleoside monophosphate kinase [bacterium]